MNKYSIQFKKEKDIYEIDTSHGLGSIYLPITLD